MTRLLTLSLTLLRLIVVNTVAADHAAEPESEPYAAAVSQQIERLEHADAYQRTLAAYRLGEMRGWAGPAIPNLIAMLDECDQSACERTWRLDTITVTSIDPETLSDQRKASRLLSAALERGTLPHPDGGYRKELLAINEIDVPPSQLTAEHYRLMGRQDRDVGAYALRISQLDLAQTVAAYADLETLSAEWRSAKERHQGDELGTKAEEFVREYEASINLLWGIEGVVKSLCRGHLAEYLAANSIEKEASELTTDDYRRMGARARLASPCQEAATALTRITGRDLGTDVERWREWKPFRVWITGRLVDESGEPAVGHNIMLYETLYDDDGKHVAKFRVSEEGRILNPQSGTDEHGLFAFVSDRRFWANSGSFVLKASVRRGLHHQRGFLRNREGIPITITVHPDAREVILGDIVVE